MFKIPFRKEKTLEQTAKEAVEKLTKARKCDDSNAFIVCATKETSKNLHAGFVAAIGDEAAIVSIFKNIIRNSQTRDLLGRALEEEKAEAIKKLEQLIKSPVMGSEFYPGIMGMGGIMSPLFSPGMVNPKPPKDFSDFMKDLQADRMSSKKVADAPEAITSVNNSEHPGEGCVKQAPATDSDTKQE